MIRESSWDRPPTDLRASAFFTWCFSRRYLSSVALPIREVLGPLPLRRSGTPSAGAPFAAPLSGECRLLMLSMLGR